jgi:hypothetical protein
MSGGNMELRFSLNSRSSDTMKAFIMKRAALKSSVNALSCIMRGVGSHVITSLEIMSTKGMNNMPKPLPLYSFQSDSMSKFNDAVDIMFSNLSHLLKASVVARDPHSNIVEQEFSLTQRGCSINGKAFIFPDDLHSTNRIYGYLLSAASKIPSGMRISFSSYFGQQVPFSKELLPQVKRETEPDSMMLPVDTAFGVMPFDETLSFIERILRNKEHGVKAVAINNATMWGFEQALVISKDLNSKRGYSIYMTSDIISKEIEKNVVRTVAGT